MQKRKAPILLGIFMVLIVIVTLLAHTASSPKAQTSTSATAKEIGSVTLINQPQYFQGAINNDDVTKIEGGILDKIASTSDKANKNVTAIIRNNSFSSTDQPNGDGGNLIPYYRFLVDIPAIKQSYQVTYFGGVDTGYAILHVLCPEKNQLIYPAFQCTDPEQ